MSADSVLSIRPEYKELIQLLDTLVDWQTFGVFLPGIKKEHIQVIEHDIRGTGLQKAELFSKWIDVHPKPSWQDVLSALKTSKEYTLFSNVCHKLKISKEIISSITDVQSQGITVLIILFYFIMIIL